MLSVAEALERILKNFQPLPAETVGIAEAFGRVLAADVRARVTQPPHAVSAMDGYAVRAADVAPVKPGVPATLRVIGAVPAGGLFEGAVGAGEAVRIFTGAAIPGGCDAVVIQEDASRDGATVQVPKAERGAHVRPAGAEELLFAATLAPQIAPATTRPASGPASRRLST